MMFLYFTFFVSLIILRKTSTGSNVLKCTQEFCDDYVQKFPCPPLDPACSNPNISIVVPSPTPCNCCELCFLFQDIGESCIIGHPGHPIPKVICKPGAECVNGICQKKEYPDPDFYPGYECNGEICSCAVIENKEPVKIFGTFKNTTDITKERQCGCSITAYNAKKSINQLLPFPDLYLPILRCLPNGQFDQLQCIDNMCGCVNTETGVWDSNIQKVAIAALGLNNPKCFDPKKHKIGEYYKMCELDRNNLLRDKFWADSEGIEILFSHKVECTPDGEYSPTHI